MSSLGSVLSKLASSVGMTAKQCLKESMTLFCDVCVGGHLPCRLVIGDKSVDLLVHNRVVHIIMDLCLFSSAEVFAPFDNSDSELDKATMKVLLGPPKFATNETTAAQKDKAYQMVVAATKYLQEFKIRAKNEAPSVVDNGEISK